MAFDRWGWSVDKDAEIVVVGTDGARLDLLLNARRVDAAIMHAPETFQAPKRGYISLRISAGSTSSFQNSCAASTRRLIKANPTPACVMCGPSASGVTDSVATRNSASHVLRKYSGETDIDVLKPTWVLFAR